MKITDIIKSILIVLLLPVSFIYALYRRQQQLKKQYDVLEEADVDREFIK